jgi:AcrR family transcriptional regulator
VGSPSAKNPRGERRRAATLAAAKAVFVEHGYAGATLDHVIERAGGSRATLYRQFGGKEGLFAAVIAEICAGIVAPLEGEATDRSPEELLLAFGRSFMAGLMDQAGLALYRVVIGEAQQVPELAAAVYRAGPAVAAERLAVHLKRWKVEGRLRLSNPDLAAQQFLEMIKGDLHFRALLRLGPPPSREDIEICVASAVRLFLEGASKH